MADEIMTEYTSGRTLYFVVLNGDRQVWGGSSWVEPSPSNWDGCAYPMAEGPTQGVYYGTFPSVLGPGIYYIVAYDRLTVSPQQTDARVRIGAMDWDGSRESGGGEGTIEVQYEIGVGKVTPGTDISTGIGGQSSGGQIETGIGGSAGGEIRTGTKGASGPSIKTGVSK